MKTSRVKIYNPGSPKSEFHATRYGSKLILGMIARFERHASAKRIKAEFAVGRRDADLSVLSVSQGKL